MNQLKAAGRIGLLATGILGAMIVLEARPQKKDLPSSEPQVLLSRERAYQDARARRLFEMILRPPTLAYEGRLEFEHVYGGRRISNAAKVIFSPPNHYIGEFLNKNGDIVRIIVSNEEQNLVYQLSHGDVLAKKMVETPGSRESSGQKLSLLARNYSIRLVGTAAMAGRSAWIVKISPQTRGKPFEKLWIDKRSKIILANMRYLPGTPYMSMVKFTRFSSHYRADPAIFRFEHLPLPPSARRPLLSASALEAAHAPILGSRDFPQSLPTGFVLETLSGFSVQGSAVRQARYTDGLSLVSLFQTHWPVLLPANGSWDIGAVYSPKIQAAGIPASGNIMQWKSRGENYVIVGDLSKNMLARLATGLR